MANHDKIAVFTVGVMSQNKLNIEGGTDETGVDSSG